MNFNQHVKRICIPEDRDNSVLKITSTEIENSEVDDETGEELVDYKSLWRKPITVSFDPNGAEGSVPDVNTRYGLDWVVPSIVVGDDVLLYHPSNFDFVGWSLDPTAPSDKTGIGDQFVFEPGSNGPLDKDDFTMHAIWNQQYPNLDEYITVYEENGPVTNDSFTIPYDGTYKFYVASGGGGGAAWWRTHHHSHSEGQGGYGYWGTFECNLAKGDVVKIPQIGGGGAGDEHKGGHGGSNGNAYGGDGGDTDLYVSRKFHVTMTGGNGGQAHGGTSDGRDGSLTRHDGVDVVKERMLRWVLPNAFGIPYANELSAWAISGIQANNTKLPTSNTNTYKNGKTYKEFWTTYLKTMPKFLDDFKGSVDLQYGNPDIFQTVKKYRPAWIHYNSPDSKYKSSPEIISLATTSVKDLVDKSNIWVKDADNKYTCSFQDQSLDDIAKMVIKNYGVKSTDGNRGTASYKSATSGVHGCVKILVKAISKYVVAWNGNGGTNPSPNSTEVEHTFAIRTAISTLPTSTRTGYTQNKWWTSAAGGAEVTLDTIVNNSFTAYAHWTPNTYTITWDSQGGTAVSPWSMSYGTTLGSHGALPIPTREGFEFDNWWTTAEGGTQVTASTSVPASNTTYYAHWIDRYPSISVKFNANGGKIDGSDILGTFGKINKTLAESGIHLPELVEYPGYSFDGWYTGRDDGIKIDTSFLIAEDLPEIYMSGDQPEIMFYAHYRSSSPESNLLYNGSFYVQNTLHDKHYYYLSPQSGQLESTSLPLRYDYAPGQVVVENMNGKNITLKCTVSGDSCNLKLHVLQPGDQISDTTRLVKSINNATGEIETTFTFPTDEGKMVLEVEPLNGNEVTIYPFTLTYLR